MTNNTTTAETTTLFKVSVGEFIIILTIWLLYCCTGKWFPKQPLRIITLIQGCAKLLAVNLWYRVRDLGMPLFVTYMLGRFDLSCDRLGICQGATIVFWMLLDTAALFYLPLKYANIVCEALMAIGMLWYVTTLILALKGQGRRHWQLALCAIFLWGYRLGSYFGVVLTK